MKRTGFLAVVLAAAMTVACGGGTRDEANTDDPNATVGTGGDVGENREIESAEAESTRQHAGMGDVQEWVRDVATHNTAEIELGKIASERASSAEVKQYAQMMVQEHTKAGAELKTAISGHNLQVQEQMDEKHRDLAQRLRGLQGEEFDREYMNAMVDGHEQVKDMLEGRANESNRTVGTSGAADDAAVERSVNQWAAKTLPSVEKHLERAQQLRGQVNGNRNRTN